MTQNTNLNISPYFDDFDESRNYRKVLFKPGQPVQSRELTTLQSILQNQIEKFGQYFFNEGSPIIPGGITYDDQYSAVKINPFFLNIPVKEYTNYLVDNNIKIKGETSGVTAVVVNSITDSQSEDGFDTLYVKYVSSGNQANETGFSDGENLITLEDIAYSPIIEQNQSFAKCIDTGATSTGCAASLDDGIYFIRGYFVNVSKETVILDQYTNSPSYKVGLSVKEDIITASTTNSDLYDNAKGFSNESAPGADRFKISTTLTKKPINNANEENFIELLRVRNGQIEKFVDTTDLNIFEQELARRTYDESGDYYIKPFGIDIRENLNDRISNRGLYLNNEITQNGNTPDEGNYTVQISPGKAYVRGYEIDKVGTTSLDAVKPRTTKKKEKQYLPINVGNVVELENVTGVPQVGFGSSDLVSLIDNRISSDTTIGTATTIGYAKVYDFNQKFNVGVSTVKHNIRLFDIQTFTTVTTGSNITVLANAFVEGQYSGSSGFVKDAVTNGTALTLYDTKGSFQINEPLFVNGINVGRNVAATRDYEFTDAKSLYSDATVGINFTADLSLNAKRPILSEGTEIAFTPATFVAGTAYASSGIATVTAPSVALWTTLVKPGDIISYKNGGQTVPVFNRIETVQNDTFTVTGISTSTGLYNGGLVGGSPTGVEIVEPSLQEGNFDGYLVPIQNEFVSSVNLLQSNYFVRKQITKNVPNSHVAGNNFSFNISDIGDTDLIFEPYTEVEYSFTWANGEKEVVRRNQVTFNATYTTLNVVGLSKKNLNLTLTALCKRTKLTSKEKTISRCNSLIVNRSKNVGAGIGSTTFGDGLAYSGVYGTRVQDRQISLNVPDIHRVLGIFESNDSANPQIPSLTVTTQTSTFTNNVTVGEQLLGNDSGALARVVTVSGGQKLEFVYENDLTFEIGENITLKTSGIIAQISSLIIGDRNIVNNYKLDKGQRLEFVDYGRIIRNKDFSEPTKKLRIIFDYFTNDETSGTIETINSYNALDYSTEIPFVFDQKVTDYVDLRPRVDAYTPSATETLSPFSFRRRNFSGSSSESLVSNKTIKIDYNFYLGRVDRLYLTKAGIFELKKGEPSESPKAPLPNNEAFEVATIYMEPYVTNATRDSNIKMVPHKRFTMKDIGSLENRIKNLEEYTTLSLLETDTKNLSIKDPNTGLDKFKSGFYVDNFRNHGSHNLTGESNFDIDITKGELRPRSTERNVALMFETKSSKLAPTTADYRWIQDFDDSNVTRNGPALTLKYDEVAFIDQQDATRVENLNPFLIVQYNGTIEITPATDFWIDEIALETPDVVRIDSVFNGMASLLGVEGENGGMAASFWNSHEQTWTGREVLDPVLTLGTRDVGRTGRETWGSREIATETTVIAPVRETGVDREFGLELTAGTDDISLGEKVVGIDILYNCRSRNIEVVGKRLKPNTQYYVFMENINVTRFCVPKLIPVTMTRGSFSVGDIIETGPSIQVQGQATIKFRAAQSNHKYGPFNAPTSTYPTEPYNGTALTSSYSNTSTTLNLDTADIALPVQPEHIGYVKKGMVLANSTGTAEAVVDTVRLISDESGSILFTLHIPDPNIASNPKFTTGSNTIKITSDSANSNILDPGQASAEGVYEATGFSQTTQEQVLSIKTPQIDRVQVNEQPITQITLSEETIPGSRWETWRVNRDPLAQSFEVPENRTDANGSSSYATDGVFITSGEVYFKTRDTLDVPVTVQIRTMNNGSPTEVVIAETEVVRDDVKTSTDGSTPTPFTFPQPVYLQSGYWYALVLKADSTGYNAFISRMGEVDLITKSLNDKQPTLGSLFKSQNASTWTASQFEDLKFKLNKAKFVTNTPSSVLLYNAELPLGKITKENPVETYSKRQLVSIATTTSTFEEGNTITQMNGGKEHRGNVSASGGPVKISSTLTTTVASGIGLTTGVFTGVGFTALTGYGNTVTCTVAVTAGLAATATVTGGGEGFAVGDLVVANNIGWTGSGLRATVGIVTTSNLIVLDDVVGTVVTGTALTHYPSSGAYKPISAPTSAPTDPIRNGFVMKFNHKNHGMHSAQNKVNVVDFNSDISPVLLSDNIDDTTTQFTVENIGILTSFEGQPVSAANTGYVKIGKEIISYTGFSTSAKQITIGTRAIDSSLKTNHSQNDMVYTYQFNEVSLRKINKLHDVDSRERGFNSYYVSLDDTNKSFSSSKVGGSKNLRVSQNIPFEAIDPRISVINPTGTSVGARIKTTSGTSISGSEASFTDKGYEPVSLNKVNELDDPRIIASKSNEYNLLGNNKSFSLELTMKTNNEDVSPFINLNDANVILMSNLVDKKVGDYESNSLVRIPGLDPNSSIYETRKIDLEFPSNSLYVQFDGHREEEADIRVFYKLFRNDSSDDGQVYIPFNSNGSPDKVVKPNTRPNAFSEYKFTAENTPQFSGFMVKVIMTSTNQAKPPRIKNYRSIALRSFASE